MKNIWIESALIGIGFGGWASSTWWPGVCGVLVGIMAWTFSYCWLLTERNETKKEIEREVRNERRKGGVFKQFETWEKKENRR